MEVLRPAMQSIEQSQADEQLHHVIELTNAILPNRDLHVPLSHSPSPLHLVQEICNM